MRPLASWVKVIDKVVDPFNIIFVFFAIPTKPSKNTVPAFFSGQHVFQNTEMKFDIACVPPSLTRNMRVFGNAINFGGVYKSKSVGNLLLYFP